MGRNRVLFLNNESLVSDQSEKLHNPHSLYHLIPVSESSPIFCFRKSPPFAIFLLHQDPLKAVKVRFYAETWRFSLHPSRLPLLFSP